MNKETPKGLMIAIIVVAVIVVIGLGWKFVGGTPGALPPAPKGTKMPPPPPPPAPGAVSP